MYAYLIVESKNGDCDVFLCGKEGDEDRDDQLVQQVTIDRQGITSRDWNSYPILRFPQAPKIETGLCPRARSAIFQEWLWVKVVQIYKLPAADAIH